MPRCLGILVRGDYRSWCWFLDFFLLVGYGFFFLIFALWMMAVYCIFFFLDRSAGVFIGNIGWQVMPTEVWESVALSSSADVFPVNACWC